MAVAESSCGNASRGGIIPALPYADIVIGEKDQPPQPPIHLSCLRRSLIQSQLSGNARPPTRYRTDRESRRPDLDL